LEAISKNPGSQGKQLSSILNNRPIKTIERHIKELTQKGLIERIGSKRTGGYFLIKKK
jgi:ATP-dependent DNA helicase RecG